MSEYQSGYYLAKMAGAIEDSDVTVLFHDGKSFYSFGSPIPVNLNDLEEVLPDPLNLCELYKLKQESNVSFKPGP